MSFDYYVSTTGSDANPGTLVSPWAITSLSLTSHNAHNIANDLLTSGKRVGIIEGTYNVSALLPGDKVIGALDFVGGSVGHPTYIASCDASGVYKQGAAVITAKTGGGAYFGGLTGVPNGAGPVIAHSGQYPQSYTTGYLTIDGLKVTGFTYKGIRIGNGSSGDGPSGLQGIQVVNCEIYDGNANGLTTDNVAALWIDCTVSAYIANNYIHDVIGPSGSTNADHINGIIFWGLTTTNAASNTGGLIEHNTLVNAGNIFGKEYGMCGTEIRFNYVDTTIYTSNAYGCQDWTGYGSTVLTGTTKIHHNIFVGTGRGLALYPTLTYSGGFRTALEVYNNTIVTTAGATTYEYIHINAQSTANGLVKCYNNIATGPVDGAGRKSFAVNALCIGVWDYNMWLPSGMTWSVTPDTLGDVQDAFTTVAGFRAKIVTNGGIANVDSHGVAATPSFITTGDATGYKLTAGTAGSASGSSPGSTDGTTGGTATDMGAWGNGAPAIIGADLSTPAISSVTLTCDAPSDPPSSTIPASTMKEVRWFKGGVLDGVSSMSGGLTVKLSKADITSGATGSAREMTVGTYVAISTAQRNTAGGIPNPGVVSDTGPACVGVVGFITRKSWGGNLEHAGPGVFDASGISHELAQCALYTPKMKLFVMLIGRTFSNDNPVTFISRLQNAISGMLNASITNGTYNFLFNSGDEKTVTVTGGTHCTWSGGVTAGSATQVATAKAVNFTSFPVPADLASECDVFTSAVDGSRGCQERRWSNTILNRKQAMLNGIAAILKADPNYNCLAGIATQETAVGSPAASTGYTPDGFCTAMKLESDYISAAFPTKRGLHLVNFLSGTTNATFVTKMSDVLDHFLDNGAVLSWPNTVMNDAKLTNVNYPLFQKYHDGTVSTSGKSGGFTLGSIQGAEFQGIPPANDGRTISERFQYLTGQIADDFGHKPNKVDCIGPDWHTTGSPNFHDQVAPLVKSATYAAPYGTISVPSGMTSGTVTQSGVDYSVLSYGTGIGPTSDAWTAARIGVNGDFTLIAKLNAVTGTDTTAAIAGISIREPAIAGANDATSRVVHLVVTASKVRSRYRSTISGAMNNVLDNTTNGGISTAKWLKIKRLGNLFTFFYASADGNTWIAMGSVTLAMSAPVYAELFSASGVVTSVTGSFKQTNIQNLANPSHTFLGLTSGTYLMTAEGVDIAGNVSAPSDPLTVVIP